MISRDPTPTQPLPYARKTPGKSWGARLVWLIIPALALCLGSAPTHGQQAPETRDEPGNGSTQIQGAVIIAHLEQDVDFPSSEALQPVLGQLREIFGYDVYQLEEVTTEDLKREGQVTRIETRPFSAAFTWLGAGDATAQGQSAPTSTAPNPQANMHHFKLQIFQKQELIVETEVEVTRDSPFYIKGPEWGRSQIIFMILVGDSPLRQDQEAAQAQPR
jgi:hypothetical protein